MHLARTVITTVSVYELSPFWLILLYTSLSYTMNVPWNGSKLSIKNCNLSSFTF